MKIVYFILIGAVGYLPPSVQASEHDAKPTTKISTKPTTRPTCATTPLAAYEMLTGKSSAAQQPKSHIININRASIAELTQLTGIGAKRAKDIVDYRLSHGDFASVDELTKVKGIGKKTLAKFQHRLSVQ